MINKKKTRPIRIVERKLGREKSWGLAYKSENLIEIEKNTKGKRRLRILLHELTHIIFPELPEYKVRMAEKKYSDAIWKQNYRRVDN